MPGLGQSGDELEATGSPDGGAAGDSGEALSLTPEAIRNSPEFRALEKQNRTLARQKGTAEAAAVAARSEAETVRQAAEAQRNAALAQQLSTTLGEDGVAAFNELAELSATDPAAAAARFAELMAGRAQSAAGEGAAAAGGPAAQAGESNVASGNTSATPPPPSQGVDGGQPLGAASTGENEGAIIAGLEKKYADVVTRNQSFATRNRVTMRDRADAMIAYLGAAYMKAMPGGPKR